MRSVYPSSVSDGLEIYTEYSCTRSALCSSEYPVLWVSRNLNLKLKRTKPTNNTLTIGYIKHTDTETLVFANYGDILYSLSSRVKLYI